jgi:hypothetical protein
MKSKKEIKAYHSHDVDVQLGKMQKEAKTLSELIKLLKEVTGDKEITTIGAFTQWLCEEAGFKSASFSAESMDLKDAYDNAHRLSNSINLITVDDLDNFHKLKVSTINKVKKQYTVYYTDEELENIKIFRDAQDKFNSLPYHFRLSMGINRSLMMFSNVSNINSKNFSH